jgi:TolB-like protein
MKKIIRYACFAGILAVLLFCACGSSPEAVPEAPAVSAPTPEEAGRREAEQRRLRGGDISLAVLVPEGRGLAADQNYLPAMVQGGFVTGLAKYSGIKVLDRQSLEKVVSETESGIYKNEKDFLQLGQIAGVNHALTGSVTKTQTGYALQIQIVPTTAEENAATKASYSASCAVAELDDFTAIRKATLELLTQLGVSLTDAAKKELSGAESREAVSAQTALAQGIAAQKNGTVVEALSYYYNAAAFDSSLNEAAGRLSELSTEIRGGNIGQNIRSDIERRREWLKVLEECAAFFQERLPYELEYDPALAEGKVDYRKETAELSFYATLQPSSGFDVVSNVLEGLNKTGKKKDWGFEGWPLSGPGKVFDRRMELSVEAALINDRGRTIASGQAVYAVGIDFLDPDTSAIYGTGNSKPVLFTVEAQDISDKLTVKITKINGRDAGAAGNSGYIKIASFSPPANAREYKIGDTGPAGGIVFYDRGTAGGWRYLEAMPHDISSGAEWGPEITIGTETWTGSGRLNTALIARTCKNAGETGAAARLCDPLTFGGYDDWFLPSRDELDLMYENLKKKGLGGFSDDQYWSSSEDESGTAWNQDFGDGRRYSYYSRVSTYSVRPVRAF